MDTTAVWLTLPSDALGEVRSEGRHIPGGLHAAEHALIHMMPLLTMCDRMDVGGMSAVVHPDCDGALVLVYDGYAGGIGISEGAYERFEELARITLDLVDHCRCETGCPSCVYDRHCGNDNQPMDRVAAALILRHIVEG
jgi:DEAD/DEAH box helicase domain-containing protein